MNRQVRPPNSISESTGSTVVPATSCTTDSWSPASLLSSELLPTLGFPTSATRRGPPSPAVTMPVTCGSAASTSSSRSSARSGEHTSELQSRGHLVCRLVLEKQNTILPCTSQCLPT